MDPQWILVTDSEFIAYSRQILWMNSELSYSIVIYCEIEKTIMNSLWICEKDSDIVVNSRYEKWIHHKFRVTDLESKMTSKW